MISGSLDHLEPSGVVQGLLYLYFLRLLSATVSVQGTNVLLFVDSSAYVQFISYLRKVKYIYNSTHCTRMFLFIWT